MENLERNSIRSFGLALPVLLVASSPFLLGTATVSKSILPRALHCALKSCPSGTFLKDLVPLGKGILGRTSSRLPHVPALFLVETPVNCLLLIPH